MSEAIKHKITIDYPKGHERYTCDSPSHPQVTLVRQTWTTDAEWKELTDKLGKEHPGAITKTQTNSKDLLKTRE